MAQSRIERAQAALVEYYLDAFIVERPEDVAYFLDDQAMSGTLLIAREEVVFFVHRMDHALYASLRIVRKVLCARRGDEELLSHISKAGYQTVGVDGEFTSVSQFQRWQKLGIPLAPIDLFTERLRSVKTSLEIERMQQAAALGVEGLDYVLALLREGITERETVRLLKTFWAKEGAEAPSFSPIVAFGEHAAFPHALTTDRPLRRGDIVLIDIGVTLNGYCSDMTRTVSWGNPDPLLADSYPIVVAAYEASMQLCRNGVACLNVYQEAVRVLQEHGLDAYFIHGLGHGVGRNVHEFPRLAPGTTALLLAGMTVTIEPGVYFPGIGGIRIEDTLCIEEESSSILSNRPVSRELVIL